MLVGFTVILQYFYSDKWLIIQISHQRCLWHISHLIASEGPNQVIIPRWGHGCITALKSNAKSEQHSSVTQLDNHLSNNWQSNLREGWKKIIHSGIQMITAFSLWFTQKKKKKKMWGLPVFLLLNFGSFSFDPSRNMTYLQIKPGIYLAGPDVVNETAQLCKHQRETHANSNAVAWLDTSVSYCAGWIISCLN